MGPRKSRRGCLFKSLQPPSPSQGILGMESLSADVVCRSGCSGGRFLGLTVVLLLGLSWGPWALLANKISSKRKIKRSGQLLRCCQLFCSYKRPDPPAGSPESRWRARYFSGHCFKGAVVEDRAANLVATVRDKVSHGPLGRGWSAHRRWGVV